eukprot:47292_1
MLQLLVYITIHFIYHGSCCIDLRRWIQQSNERSNSTPFHSYYINNDGFLIGQFDNSIIKMNIQTQEIMQYVSIDRVNDPHVLDISSIAHTNYMLVMDGNSTQISLKLYDTTTFNLLDIKTVIDYPMSSYDSRCNVQDASLSTLGSNILILWTTENSGALFYSLWKLPTHYNSLLINVNAALLFESDCWKMAKNPQTLLISPDEANQLFHIVYVIDSLQGHFGKSTGDKVIYTNCPATYTGDKVIAQTININGTHSDQTGIHYAYANDNDDDFQHIRFLEFIKTSDDMFIIPWCGTFDRPQQCWIHMWLSMSAFYSNTLDSYDKYAVTYFLDGWDNEWDWDTDISLSSMAIIEGENIYKSYIFYIIYLDDKEVLVRKLHGSIVDFNGTVLYNEIILNECNDSLYICDFSVKSHENQFIIVYTYCGNFNWHYKTIDMNQVINGECDLEYCTGTPAVTVPYTDLKNTEEDHVALIVAIAVIAVIVMLAVIWKMFLDKKKRRNGVTNKFKPIDNTRHVSKNNSSKQLDKDTIDGNQTLDEEIAVTDVGNTNQINNGEDEGEYLNKIGNEEMMRIKRWFEEEIAIDNEGKPYYALFIENGFERLHLIKYITDLELQSIGVDKMGHRKAILLAATKL